MRKNSAIFVLMLALGGLLVFAIWAYNGRQDYKKSSDKKTAAAVTAAESAQKVTLQAQFDNQAKSPYKTFKGDATYGSVTFSYPKTWSVYVDQTNASSEPINAYFYPDIVPGTQSGTAFALRLELTSTAYSDTLQQFNGNITNGKLTASAYVPPKIKAVANVQPGVKMDGLLTQDSTGGKTGSAVVIKVRDKTMQIYTQSNNFLADFTGVILPSLTFVP